MLEAVVEVVVVGVGGVVAGEELGYRPDWQVYGGLVPVQLLGQYLGLARVHRYTLVNDFVEFLLVAEGKLKYNLLEVKFEHTHLDFAGHCLQQFYYLLDLNNCLELEL